jgi:hypothetical protein
MRGIFGLCVVLAAGSASARQCVVEGKAVEPFTVAVAPKGGLALSLKVRGVGATAKISEAAAAPATVEVHGSLSFSGVTAVEKLPLQWKSTVDSATGMVRLPAGSTAALQAHAKGKWLEGDLMLDGIRFRGVMFPCDGATLDAVNAGAANVEPEEDAWIAKDKTISLRAGAGKGPTMEIVMPEAGSISWHRVEHEGQQVRIAAKLRDGTYVTGWVKPAALTRPAGGASAGELRDLPIPSQCAHAPEAKPGTQLVNATIDLNTAVLYDRLFQWGMLKTTEPVQVRMPSSGNWAEVVVVPGIATATDCDADTVLEEGWIPRSSVHPKP